MSASSSSCADEMTLCNIARLTGSQHDSGKNTELESKLETKTRWEFPDFESDFERLVAEESDRGFEKCYKFMNKEPLLICTKCSHWIGRQWHYRRLASYVHVQNSVSEYGKSWNLWMRFLRVVKFGKIEAFPARENVWWTWHSLDSRGVERRHAKFGGSTLVSSECGLWCEN